MLFVYVGLLVLAIVFPKSKPITMFSLLFMFVMYTFAYYEGDLQIYEWIYKDYGIKLSDSTFEPGFNILMSITKSFGLSFTYFRAVLAFIYTGLLFRGLKKNTEYIALAVTLTGIFPFFVFTSVVRSGISCVILLNGYNYLFDEKNEKRGIIKYLFVVAVSTLFHYSSIFMAILVIARKRINMNRIVMYAIGMIAIAALIIRADILYMFLSHFTDRVKTLQWLCKGEGTANIKGTIAIIVILSMNYYLGYRSLTLIEIVDNDRKNTHFLKLAEFCYHSATIVLFLLPLMLMASPFMRLLYIMVPLNVGNALNAAYGIKSNRYCITTVTLQGILLFISLFIMKLYYDLPYIRSGYEPFQELIMTKFVFY